MNSTRSRNRIRPALLALLALIALALFLSTPAAAQEVTGSLQGTVLSPEKTPEQDVHITVAGPHLQGTRETATDRRGFFQFLALPPGTYELRAGRIGFQPILVRDLVVELGRTTAVPTLTLTTQAVEMAPVEIVAPPASLDPVHTTMGGVIKAEEYAALPGDRDYKSIISILPHANESYRGDPVNVGGSTGLENQYYIDGVNVTDSKLANRATSLPYNFVRSVNVRTGGYEARYGRALGAVVDAVTYSGTNDFEANIFGVALPGALTMDPKGAAVVREEGAVYYDFGGRISGPLVLDRLWYSAALNPRVDQVDKEIIGFGFHPDKTTTTRFAGKLAWRASSSTDLEVSVFGDPTTHDAVIQPDAFITTVKNPDPLLTRDISGGTVASIRGTVASSKSLLLQASLGRQWDRYSTEAATSRGSTEVAYFDHIQTSVEGGVMRSIHEDRGRTNLSVQGALTLPRHTLVVGADYEDLVTTSRYAYRSIIRADTSTWTDTWERYGGTFNNRSPAVYIQDTWRIADQVALNAGMRWSEQYLVGESRQTHQRLTNEWQPRAGFSWQLGNAAADRLFGSFGRFYQTIPTNLAVVWYLDYGGGMSIYSTDPRQPGSVPDQVMDWSLPESSVPTLSGIAAENFDEFTLGYERLLAERTTLTVRGIRRSLRSSFQWGADFSRSYPYVLGTPGKGDFSFLPPAKREYTALELSVAGSRSRLGYRASYVLSRSWGNYTGLYGSDEGFANPGEVSTFFSPYQATNSTGALPNDHTHVFKLSTSYATPIDVKCGAFLTLESGSPINDFAAGPVLFAVPLFVTQRGAAGRTPTVWNLDLRLAYDLPGREGPKTRVQLDVLHVGNPRGTVLVDEWHYLTVDANGNPTSSSSNYKKPKAYQPPMAVRLGIEVNL